MRRLPLVLTITFAFGAILLSRATARAHFFLSSPASWDSQSQNLGDPQKSAPCGQADPGTAAVPSNMVTAFHPGDSVTITVDEKIFHPGHYRVTLADSQANLPQDPPVTTGSTACGSTTIQNPPVFPVLADGMLLHTSAFSGPQTFTVTLPANMTCDKCSLQVVEFMSNHGLNNPGGCFYHHCADISIQPAGGGNDAGGSGNDGGTNPPKAGGGGCAVANARASAGSLAGVGVLAAAAMIFALRRRRRGH